MPTGPAGAVSAWTVSDLHANLVLTDFICGRVNARVDQEFQPMPQPTLCADDFGEDIGTEDENENT